MERVNLESIDDLFEWTAEPCTCGECTDVSGCPYCDGLTKMRNDVAALVLDGEVLRSALDLLVNLKNYRDVWGKTPTYTRFKGVAWQTARDALDCTTNYDEA